MRQKGPFTRNQLATFWVQVKIIGLSEDVEDQGRAEGDDRQVKEPKKGEQKNTCFYVKKANWKMKIYNLRFLDPISLAPIFQIRLKPPTSVFFCRNNFCYRGVLISTVGVSGCRSFSLGGVFFWLPFCGSFVGILWKWNNIFTKRCGKRITRAWVVYIYLIYRDISLRFQEPPGGCLTTVWLGYVNFICTFFCCCKRGEHPIWLVSRWVFTIQLPQ